MNFNFGNTPTTTTGNTGISFGGGDVGGIKPSITFGAPAPTASQPGLAFGAPAPTATSAPNFSFGSTQPTAGFNLGGTAAATTSAPALGGFSLPAATPKSSSGGFSLGGPPLTQTITTTTSAPISVGLSAPTTGFAFNSTQLQSSVPTTVQTATTASAGFSIPAATPSATTSTSGFGSIPATGFTVAAPTSSTAISLGIPKPTPSVAIGASVAPSVSLPVPTGLVTTTSAAISNTTGLTTTTLPTSSLNFTELEEAINKWTLELDEQEKVFMNQALQLNAWDRILITNGDKVLELNSIVERVKQEQQQLDHELDFVVAQQRELEESIAPLEKELEEIPVTDLDRQHTYQLAENLDTQLKQMSEDLKEIIEHLNETTRNEDTNDPIVQIGRILNAHMNSLQWIDRNTALINSQLDEVAKLHETHRREHERTFHLSY